MKKIIAFQGTEGAYSDLACRAAYPDFETLPCETFFDAFKAVENGQAPLAMIAVDNTLAGRVADVHHLIPNSQLHIIGEHFQPIRHMLQSVPGAKIEDLKHVHSHIHALPQCREIIRKLGLKSHVESDTATAAKIVKEKGDKSHAAIASSLAADIYGLEILQEDVQDAEHNTTRFLVLSKDMDVPEYDPSISYVTSFIFRVRNIPAALYKAMGGFATNNVNMVKLESYVDKEFQVAQFYADVIGHPESRPLQLAMEELGFFAEKLTYLGTYPAHPFRNKD